jgi:2-methylisocitrate lyase-like PEP mutase family enzyme
VTNSHPANSPGARLRRAIEEERPLQMVGAVNAFCALLAQSAGFRAIYLSGAGVANASFGLPDLGITNLNDVADDVEAGADLIFAEAVTSLEDYRRFTETLSVPVLANLTEFGKTPLFSIEEMRASGIRIILYPLGAFRAMAAAAETVYQTTRRTGSQKDVLSTMQTREHLYEILNYHEFESRLDSFSKHQI